MVNDGSTDGTLSLLTAFNFKTPNLTLHIIDLHDNMGHQAAIYRGMLYAQTLPCSHFIVMDSDGEDSPAAIPRLLQHLDADAVHVIRSKRKESLLFRACYYSYKALFRAVTGQRMNFGNFCLINRRILELAIHSRFSHFAAFLSKQKCTVRYIVAEKEERIGGRSKMGFRKLFHHAIRSFAEYRTGNPRFFLKRSVSR
jgi:glycosyltransferase involved in cell wall biosynthesis